MYLHITYKKYNCSRLCMITPLAIALMICLYCSSRLLTQSNTRRRSQFSWVLGARISWLVHVDTFEKLNEATGTMSQTKCSARNWRGITGVEARCELAYCYSQTAGFSFRVEYLTVLPSWKVVTCLYFSVRMRVYCAPKLDGIRAYSYMYAHSISIQYL